MKDPQHDPKQRDPERQKARTEEHQEPPETAEHPAPGVEHKTEPDAENIVPAEDRPGTF